jgi:hypothetical protein
MEMDNGRKDTNWMKKKYKLDEEESESGRQLVILHVWRETKHVYARDVYILTG